MFRPERVVVPNPVFETVNHGADVEPTYRENRSPATELTDNLALGVDEPTPRDPVLVNVDVAVTPKYATPAESCVDDACPLRSSSDVVADCPA